MEWPTASVLLMPTTRSFPLAFGVAAEAETKKILMSFLSFLKSAIKFSFHRGDEPDKAARANIHTAILRMEAQEKGGVRPGEE